MAKGMGKELTSSYMAFAASLFQKITLPDEAREGTLTQDGVPVASIWVSPRGLSLAYRITDGGGSSDVNEFISFDWTFPQYGGRRIWFLCPRCGRRRGVLYMGWGVACRECLDLAYPCEQSRFDKGWALHQRWLSRIKDGKPKRMRWRTYGRLRAKIEDRLKIAVAPVYASFRRKGLIRREGGAF